MRLEQQMSYDVCPLCRAPWTLALTELAEPGNKIQCHRCKLYWTMFEDGRALMTITEGLCWERLAEALRDRPFEVGDQVVILTAGHEWEGCRAIVVEIDHHAKYVVQKLGERRGFTTHARFKARELMMQVGSI